MTASEDRDFLHAVSTARLAAASLLMNAAASGLSVWLAAASLVIGPDSELSLR